MLLLVFKIHGKRLEIRRYEMEFHEMRYNFWDKYHYLQYLPNYFDCDVVFNVKSYIFLLQRTMEILSVALYVQPLFYLVGVKKEKKRSLCGRRLQVSG